MGDFYQANGCDQQTSTQLCNLLALHVSDMVCFWLQEEYEREGIDVRQVGYQDNRPLLELLLSVSALHHSDVTVSLSVSALHHSDVTVSLSVSALHDSDVTVSPFNRSFMLHNVDHWQGYTCMRMGLASQCKLAIG